MKYIPPFLKMNNQESYNQKGVRNTECNCTNVYLSPAAAAAAAAMLLQLCPTLCDPIDGSPLGSSVSGIL